MRLHAIRTPRHRLHIGINGSKLVLIPGVGHALDIEAGERFNAEVRAFLQAQRGDRG